MFMDGIMPHGAVATDCKWRLPGPRGRKTTKGSSMKSIFLGAVSVIALGMSVPASAADLAARPYTKAPPMVAAAVYDWSGFYIGGNGGGGWSLNCWVLVGSPAGLLVTPLAE